MFTKTDSQLSLFDVENVFPDALPKDDWSYIYGDRIYSLIDEEQFRHLYKQAEQVNKDDDIITDIHGYGEGNVARGGVSVPQGDWIG